MDAEERHGFEGDGFSYLKSPIWWAGIVSRMRLTTNYHTSKSKADTTQ